ncbi:reverse transcriptase domain-containing protein [Tanacetum coccineum]
MRTRNSNFPNNSNVIILRRRNKGRAPNVVELELRTIVEVAPIEQYMGSLLRQPTEGYGEAIVLPEINADHFEIKTNLLQDVSNDVIKLVMFPYSLEGAAKVWYEKEPPNSFLTWEDLVTKFVNQFFPPSKTTHLKNEISRFTQKFEETFSEAWERFKEMLKSLSPTTDLKRTSLAANARRNNEKALNILLSAIPDRHLLSFHDAVDARSLWKAIKARLLEETTHQRRCKRIPRAKFEVSMKLPSVWHVVATNDSRQPGLMSFDFDDLYNNLKVYEHELKGVSINSPNIAFSVHRSQGKIRDLKLEEKQKELDQALKERDDFKVKLEKWTNASVLQNEVLNKQRYVSDKSCIGFGIEEKAYKAVPPPTGTIIPPRANVSFTGIDELAIRNKVVNQEKTKSSQPEIDRNKVIIEDWVDSDDEETDVSESQKETAFNSENSETSFGKQVTKQSKQCWSTNLGQRTLGTKGMDNRRPRISSYSPSSRSSNPRTTYRPQRPKKIVKSIWVKKGSTVGSQAVLPQTISVKKSAMITSKQTWRQKGNYLDSVNRDNGSYTLKQFEATRRRLKDYAIIDSGWLWEHNVLFTDKECLILSPKFKFVDEDLVILRAPRKNDVYSLDLKNIIPSEDNYPGHLAARLGCAETKVATWDDLAFKLIILGWNVKHSTDIANISRKRSKPDKHGHGNGRVQKSRKFLAKGQ